MEFDEGLAYSVARLLAMGLQGGEWHVVGAGGVIFLTQDGTQQGVGGLYQRAVSAESQVQVNAAPAGCGHVGLHGAEDGHVGPTEAVDALFSVADDEEGCALTPSPWQGEGWGGGGEAGQGVDDAPLAFVGILKLVHQHGVDLGLPAGAHVSVILQQGHGAGFQVVEVECPPRLFELLIFGQGVFEEAAQVGQGLGSLLVKCPGDRLIFADQGRDLGVVMGAQHGHCLASCYQFTGVPVAFGSADVGGTAQGCQAGEKRLRVAARPRGFHLVPVGKYLAAGQF